MPLTFTTKIVAIEWPAGAPVADGAENVFTTAEIVALDHPAGEQFGIAQLRFPRARAGQMSAARGKAIRVKYNGFTVFGGHVTEISEIVAGEADGGVLLCHDYRWYLSKRIVGQYGTGDADATFGRFPTLGFRVHFNPDNRYNRSAEKAEGASVYTFSNDADAVAWRTSDILEFLLHYYAPGITFATADFPAAYATPQPDFFPFGMNVGDAISRLLARHGHSWSLLYDGDAIGIAFIANAILPEEPEPSNWTDGHELAPGTPTFEVTLAEHGTGARASSTTETHARSVRQRERITDSVDRVEVHSANYRVDMTLTNSTTDTNAYCGLKSISTVGMGWPTGWQLDLTKFVTGAAGFDNLNFPAGVIPIRWRRELASRLTDNLDAYYAADDAALLAGAGAAVFAEMQIWFRYNAEPDATPRRIVQGFRISPESMTLFLDDVIVAADGTEFQPALTHTIWITVSVEFSGSSVLYTALPPADGYLVDAAHPQTMIVSRNDLVPFSRYRVKLADPNSLDPNAVLTFATSSRTDYRTIDTQLRALHSQLAGSRRAEQTVEIDLVDIPRLVPGSRLVVGPDDLDLETDLVVIRYECEFGERNLLRLFATNNLARVIGGDL